MADNQSPTQMNTQNHDFFKFTTTRPVAILMIVLGVIVFGLISYQQLAVNLMPDISYPSLTVRTEYTGTAPEEIETSISRPVEQALGVVGNLVSISSISKAGISDVKLEFTWDAEMNRATADVREKLDQVFLPEDAERPLILRYDPTLDPIMRLGLYGDRSLTRMRYRAEEEIKRILETIPGVAAVKVKGGFEEEIRVELNEQKITLIGIDIQTVRQRLSQENVNLAGGNLKEGQTEYLVRTLNEFQNVNEIEDVVIGIWNGREIKIKDVADVKRTSKEREIISRINGEESVEIEIFKEADQNIVDVANRVKMRVFGTPEQQAFVKQLEEKQQKQKDAESDTTQVTSAESTNGESASTNGGADDFHTRLMTSFIAYQLPDNTQIETLSDQSIFIQNSVDEVMNTAFIGGVLAIIVLFIFLRKLSATVIIGIAIPISIIATFAPMKMFDVSLNIMSLGGLALGIGMLVDNSIVVLESIARCREEGDGIIDATVRGVGEVGSAVFASTLTTVAVFFPIVFVEGIAGQIFGDLALTVVFSLLASLMVALFLIPMLSSRNVQQFAGGMQVGDLLKKNILLFQSEAYIAELRKENTLTLSDKAKIGIKALAFVPVSFFFKLVLVVAGFALTFLKAILLYVAVLISPILFLGRIMGLIHFKISESAALFAKNQHADRLHFVQNIWPTFFQYDSVPDVFEGFHKQWQKYSERSNLKNVLYSIVLLPVLFYLLIKFVVFFLLELVGKFLHTVFMAVALLLKALALMVGILFAVPAKLTVAGFNFAYGYVELSYPKLLKGALENRTAVLGGVAIVFALCIFVIAPRVGSELIPEVHQGEFNVEVILPVGTPVEETDERMLPIQQYLASMENVEKVASVAGTDRTSNASSEEGEHTAKLTVTVNRDGRLIDTEERLISEIREELQSYSGLNWKISRPTIFSFKTPIEVEIHGYNLQNLQDVSQRLEESLNEIPGLFDVRSNIQRGNPEVQIVYNRQLLAQFGLNIREVASIVRNKIRGDVATEFKEQDRKIDVLVQLRENDRQSVDDLRNLIINPGNTTGIPLHAVASVRVNEGPSEIRRIDQQRTAVITANISGRDLQSVSEDIYKELQRTEMPQDFTYNLAGQNEEMETSLNSLQLALGLAIFLVYIVMASQFESLVHPFVIIFTIPLALIGVILGLFVLNIPVSIVVFLGMIMLAGIVVNNAIVLVDYINQLRHRGMKKMEAILEAGKARLRPIFMTTLTTVLGLLPMALGVGDGAEIRSPMAATVILGLIASTLLTLVVIPTVYSVVDRKE